MTGPQYSVRLYDLPSLLQNIERASHLAVSRPTASYFHHFIVQDVTDNYIRIIQYGQNKFVCTVHEKTLFFGTEECAKLLDFHSGLYLIKDPSYPTTDAGKDKVLARARSRLGEEMYQASTNNCEHFVTFAFKGAPSCNQLKDCGFFKKVLAYFIDAVVEYPTHAVKGAYRAISIKLAEVINNFHFYKSLAMKALKKWPSIIQTAFGCIGNSVECIADEIARVASLGKLVAGSNAIVEVGMLLRTITELSVHYAQGLISAKDMAKQCIKRMVSSITAVSLDWRFIPGFIASITPFYHIAGYSLIVAGSQLFVSFIAPILIDLGSQAFQWLRNLCSNVFDWLWGLVQTSCNWLLDLLQQAFQCFVNLIKKGIEMVNMGIAVIGLLIWF